MCKGYYRDINYILGGSVMEKVKKPIYKKWWFWVLIIILFTKVMAMTTPDSKEGIDSNQFSIYKIVEDDVKNGFDTEVIGKRGYIETDLKFEDIDYIQLKSFYEKNIKDREYNWFTIFLKNDEGLVFHGGNDMAISYGEVEKDGGIKDNLIGNLMITGDEKEPYKYTKF